MTTMKNRLYTAIIFFFLSVSVFICSIKDSTAAEGRNEPEIIIERIVKVEGSVEKPRVIFIVPRARLWRPWIERKSFVPNILNPVYPDFISNEGDFNNPARR